jgi:hypothetical protein
MVIKRVVLVIVDISGYTKFLKLRRISLLHAEQIITGLLEAVIDKAEHPLILNKLEGDAAFLYSETGDRPEAVATDAVQQVRGFFEAFRDKAVGYSRDAMACICDACVHVGELRLKAVLHQGEVVIKQLRQFEELAGEDVILVHRLLKNSIPSNEYVAMTKSLHTLGGDIPGFRQQDWTEKYDDVGSVDLKVFFPGTELGPIAPPPITFLEGVAITFQRNLPLLPRMLGLRRGRSFNHID